ncbi:MAG: hypothetical protein ABIL68_01910 [bacterium]
MKRRFIVSTTLLFLLAGINLVIAQDEAVVTSVSEAAEGLDLQAISELFKESEDLESFEKALNDSDVGVNNLDLDENGEVDFIRVVEEATDDLHVIVLQVCLGKDEFQDVATIEVEKTGEESYNMQVRGNEELYGVDYYVAPTVVRIHTWPIIARIYAPRYRPYRSRYYWGFYPNWWRPRRPVVVNVYRTRLVRYRTRPSFVVTKTGRITTIHKVKYQPRRSTLVKKRVIVRPAPRRRRR